jgi:hypothetical protein
MGLKRKKCGHFISARTLYIDPFYRFFLKRTRTRFFVQSLYVSI